MTLATAVSLAALRGPAPLAKAVAALDILSGGRVVAGSDPAGPAPGGRLIGTSL